MTQRTERTQRNRRKTQSNPIVPERIRSIGTGGFAFVPNRFLHEGFFAALCDDERVLYLLLVLISNRQGMSYYHYDSLCDLLCWPVERYVTARNSLIARDLIAFDGTRLQVLELPASPPEPREPLETLEQLELHDPATVRCVLNQALRQRG